MSVWVISAVCGDYYCGCGIGHLVGVATSAEDAERIRVAADASMHYWPDGRAYKPLYDATVTRFPVDTFVPREIG